MLSSDNSCLFQRRESVYFFAFVGRVSKQYLTELQSNLSVWNSNVCLLVKLPVNFFFINIIVYICSLQWYGIESGGYLE